MRELICAVFIVGSLSAQEKVDLYTINRIKNEAFQNSKVMENAFYLTDVYGPRLTGSPGIQAAGEWAVRRFNEWGLANVKLENWGPFGRTWYCVRFGAHMKEPQYAPLIGFARPWSPGTNGTLTGDPVLAPIRIEADMEKFKGKLKGKIVLLEDARPSPLVTAGLARRFTNEELAAEALAPDPSPESPFFAPIPKPPQGPLPYPGYTGKLDREAARKWRNKVNKFLREEGVALTLIPGYGTDGGTVFATAAGSRELRDEVPPPAVALTLEHYNRIARLLEKKTPVTLQFDIENRMENEEKDSLNVTAEIPGGKGGKKDEVVMLGAHLDSWSGGTGATDNAAGCAVTMEAIRILKALKLDMPRTVRIALWTGEEQGLLGSKAYVKEHFADRETMALKSEHAKLSGYFNLDNGTGKIRGVYLQDNDMMRPLFEAWLAPFKDLGASTVTIRKTGGTDHLSFDAVGLPGFQFIQDPVEYGTRTHHSNMDLYDRLQQPDLMQAAAIMASVVYHAATRDQMLPRKELPKPEPKKKPEEEKEKEEKARVVAGY
ncbi:MAG TPA: M20/M25/M40 family metallo-hydrolase [Bryobacteraceae bacterium]|nr:M20/M25/M40 family metallo-hydrolase [Bryobacteraceae bacterium]